MSEIRLSTKPTLGILLNNPQNEYSARNSPEKVVFPRINTNLKKTHFTKYRSAFISSQSCGLDLQTQSARKFQIQQSFKKLNTEIIPDSHTNYPKSKSELNKKLWKLNKKHHKSHSMKSPQKLIKDKSKISQNVQQDDKVIQQSHLNDSDSKRNQKFSLLTQIRELHNISPIQRSQTCRNEKNSLRKKQEINQNIQRSNKIIQLIQKNCRQGFFSKSPKKQSSLQKLEEKLGLFSYLKRNFITKKQTLTNQKLKEYFKTPSNKKLQAKINFETRSFLKDKLHNDYHSYKEVNRLRDNLSKDAIKQQIQQKNVEFRQEYNKKYNIPYLSFMSLPKGLKIKVLQNLTQETAKLSRK